MVNARPFPPQTKVFWKNYYATKKIVVNYGGARSGKSFSIRCLFLKNLFECRHGVKLCIARKTTPALKMTEYLEFFKLMKKLGLYRESNHNKTDKTYEWNGNHLQFLSFDDPEKIRSSEFNYIWLEEATEFTFEDYVAVLTRLSAENHEENNPNRLYLTLNPTDVNSWINKKLIHMDDVEVIHSTYRDNPFLSPEYVKTLLSLKELDETSYRTFAEGEWVSLANVIYPQYDTYDVIPSDVEGSFIYGLDFGFNNPSALVKVYYNDTDVWIEEKLYERELTNTLLIEKLKEIAADGTIIADSAEPDRISEIYSAGLDVKPANKGKISAGITKVKGFHIHINRNSPNLLKEIQSYSWRKDRNGVIFDEPVKFNDHALDAMRYAITSLQPLVSSSSDSFDIEGENLIEDYKRGIY